MKYHTKNLFTAAAVLVVFVLAVLVLSASSTSPYDQHEMFPKYASFESMVDKTDASGNASSSNASSSNASSSNASSSNASSSNASPTTSSITSASSTKKEQSESKPGILGTLFNVFGPTASPAKEGMTQLYDKNTNMNTASNVGENAVIDKLSKINSYCNNQYDKNCITAGYSNSNGLINLASNPEMLKLLTTRGGNM